MKRMGKKALLDFYSFVKDEDFKNILKIQLPDYYSLVKSEELAKEFLESRGVTFVERYPERKVQFEDMLRCANYRGIDVDDIDIDYEISIGDVLNRINEQESFALYSIERAYEGKAFLNPSIATGVSLQISEVVKKYEELKDEYVLERKESKSYRRK
jgi:hypothetical protein